MEIDHELKKVLKEAFGESSESESDSDQPDPPLSLQNSSAVNEKRESIFGEMHTWEPIAEINGLWLCRDFLSSDQQSSLLSAIQNEGWFAEATHNQAMRFGDLPFWAVELSNHIRESVLFSGYSSELSDLAIADLDKDACGVFPPELLWREPLFNQLIVNVYQPGEGIRAHVDLMRFADGIAIISLESSCVMHFSRIEGEFKAEVDIEGEICRKVPLLLIPGSLVLLWGEARYLWTHEINRRTGFQKWGGHDIDQKRRTSITLRRMAQVE